jgi:hypothetical protein
VSPSSVPPIAGLVRGEQGAVFLSLRNQRDVMKEKGVCRKLSPPTMGYDGVSPTPLITSGKSVII